MKTTEKFIGLLADRADRQLERELKSPSAGQFFGGFRLVENPTIPENELQFRDRHNRILCRLINMDAP